jgi:cytochrome bd-type quinol oxidase subunit 2
VAFEYRGKVDSVRWRRNWDLAIAFGSWVPAVLWGVAFANIVAGVPIDENGDFTGSLLTLLNPFGLLGGVVTASLFLLHGAHFLALKTEGEVRDAARRLGLRIASSPSGPGPCSWCGTRWPGGPGGRGHLWPSPRSPWWPRWSRPGPTVTAGPSPPPGWPSPPP